MKQVENSETKSKSIIDGAFGKRGAWADYPNLHDAIAQALCASYVAGRNDALGITPMAVANRELCALGLCVHKTHSEKSCIEKDKDA